MFKRALGLGVAIIIGAVLVSASGAATTSAQKVTRINVSTRAAVVHYLRSIHVNSKRVVIQRGLRNYAGAHCPGKGWTCAGTRHTVVQIAKRGGLNRFACGTAKCAVVQLGGSTQLLRAASRATLPPGYPTPQNLASCIKTTGITGSCTINQPNASGTNEAVVWMDTGKQTGLTQTANFSASITQGPASPGTSSNWNLACVHQLVNIDGSATKTNGANVTVNNNSYQSASITQNSLSGSNAVQGAIKAGTGKNTTYDCGTASSPMTQSETLTSTVSTKGSITQNEDAAANGANVLVTINQNHSPGFACSTSGPLVCPSSGNNTATFTQTMNQTAIANKTGTTGSVNQTQSSPDVLPNYSGLVGTVNQDTNSSGTSTASTTQNETQCEDAFNPATDGSALLYCEQGGDPTAPGYHDGGDLDAPGYTVNQTQYGPEGVFKAPAQGHGPVHYAHKGFGQATQAGGTHDVFTINQTSQQDADKADNQHNTVEADCTTPGGCTVNQTVVINGKKTGPVTNSGQDLSGITIDCTGSTCTQSPPPGPICNAGTGTTGAAYNAIPSDVAHCGPSSEAFEAQQTNEFGDEVTLDTTGGTNLAGMKVDFQSYGCGVSGHWYSGDCVTNSGDTFTIPGGITATVYSVGPNDTLGSVLATSTVNPSIPYRPSASPSCTGDDAGKWFDSVAGKCRNSYSDLISFNNWNFANGSPSFTNGQKVIWTVRFNTTHYGYNPIGENATCFASTVGCGYDSLNVGTQSFTGAPYAGTDVSEDVAFRSSGSIPSEGPPPPLTAETGWTGFRPLGEIILGPSAPALTFSASSDGFAGQCGSGPITLTTGASAGTFAKVAINNLGNVLVSGLPEPTFTTDNYAAGSPRYYLTLSDGNSLWGYPPNSNLNGSNFAWAINNASTYQSWAAVQSAEGSATVVGASVIADGDQPSTTDTITNLTFNGTNFTGGSCIE